VDFNTCFQSLQKSSSFASRTTTTNASSEIELANDKNSYTTTKYNTDTFDFDVYNYPSTSTPITTATTSSSTTTTTPSIEAIPSILISSGSNNQPMKQNYYSYNNKYRGGNKNQRRHY